MQYRDYQLKGDIARATGFMAIALLPVVLVFVSNVSRFLFTEDYPDDLLTRISFNGSILLIIITFIVLVNLFRNVKTFDRVVFVYMVLLGALLSTNLRCSRSTSFPPCTCSIYSTIPS